MTDAQLSQERIGVHPKDWKDLWVPEGIVTGNPIDLDALREALARGLHDHDCGDPWEDVLGPEDEQHRDDYYERADAALAVVAPLIAELRQHRQLADHLYDDAQAIVNKDPASLGRRGALLDAASRVRNIQRGPVPPEETP